MMRRDAMRHTHTKRDLGRRGHTAREICKLCSVIRDGVLPSCQSLWLMGTCPGLRLERLTPRPFLDLVHKRSSQHSTGSTMAAAGLLAMNGVWMCCHRRLKPPSSLYSLLRVWFEMKKNSRKLFVFLTANLKY